MPYDQAIVDAKIAALKPIEQKGSNAGQIIKSLQSITPVVKIEAVPAREAIAAVMDNSVDPAVEVRPAVAAVPAQEAVMENQHNRYTRKTMTDADKDEAFDDLVAQADALLT